jgi:hypothetical protein
MSTALIVGWAAVFGALLLIAVLKVRKRALGAVHARSAMTNTQRALLTGAMLLVAALPAALVGWIPLPTGLLYLAAGLLLAAVASAGVEVREHGLVLSDAPIRWQRIEEWSWPATTPPRLRLTIRRPLGFRFAVRIDGAQRDTVERLLRAHAGRAAPAAGGAIRTTE